MQFNIPVSPVHGLNILAVYLKLYLNIIVAICTPHRSQIILVKQGKKILLSDVTRLIFPNIIKDRIEIVVQRQLQLV